jgi:membrane protease YdiL (CAAX protease family)
LSPPDQPLDVGPDGAPESLTEAPAIAEPGVWPPIEPAGSATGSSAVSRPGASTFTIEGRTAPALYFVGWLATLIGLGLIAVAIMGGDTPAGRILLIVGLVPLSIGLIAAAGSQGIERKARGRLPYRGPSPFLVLAASLPVSVLALVLVSVPLGLLGVPLDGPFAALISVSVQAVVYVGLVRLLVVDTGALDWAAMGVGRLDRRAAGEIGGGLVWILPVVLVTGILAAILTRIIAVDPVSPLPPTGTAVGFALSLAAGVVVAPFGEEILFRAFATTAWARGLGARRGVLVGALVFAFVHVITVSGSSAGDALGLAFVAFVGRLPISFALGWLFLRRGSVWASFGLHAGFNATLLILAEVAARAV